MEVIAKTFSKAGHHVACQGHHQHIAVFSDYLQEDGIGLVKGVGGRGNQVMPQISPRLSQGKFIVFMNVLGSLGHMRGEVVRDGRERTQ